MEHVRLEEGERGGALILSLDQHWIKLNQIYAQIIKIHHFQGFQQST